MESTYYNVAAPASYAGLNKFKPKWYTKKEVREWLQSQDTYTLHKPTRRRFSRRQVVVNGIDHQRNEHRFPSEVSKTLCL
jgi:hypothetical protein